MTRYLLGVAAASLLFVAVPASAQDIGVSVGEGGVRVGVDRDRDRRDYRDHRGSTRIYTEGRRSRGCTEVTTKKRMPDGTVVIKKSERC